MLFRSDLGIHLKGLVAHATGQSKFKTVHALSLESLQDAWEGHRRATDFAINFLKSNCGITSPALLSSPFILISIGYLGERDGYRISEQESQLLRRWVLTANAKGRYSRGSTETFLDQDWSTIRDGGSAIQLLERLKLQVGRLDITAEELEGRDQRSALFKTMFLVFSSRGATDWQSGLAIDLKRTGAQHKIQFHHVFPQALLKDIYSRSQINDISNLAFIDATTNRRILASKPAEYLPKIIAEGRESQLVRQDIPIDPDLYGLDTYLEFLARRRTAICASLNAFLGSAAENHPELEQ